MKRLLSIGFATINGAIAKAAAGDAIHVAAGTARSSYNPMGSSMAVNGGTGDP
jgi:hypothetical protein